MKIIYLVSLLIVLFGITIFSQNSPEYVGEFSIQTINFSDNSHQANVNISLKGMGFSGSALEQKVYSNTYTKSGTTQSITGASYILYGNDRWNIQHIEGGAPTPGKTWIGYGLYKITINDNRFEEGPFYFYIDYLDSEYPYSPDNADITVDYDYNRPLTTPIHVYSNYGYVYPRIGQVIRVWADLYNKGDNPVGTDFFLNGNVPCDASMPGDTLFTHVIVDGDVTVNLGKTFSINRSLYPQPEVLQALTLDFNSSTSLAINGTLNANGTSGNHIIFTSTGSASPGSWGSIILNGSGANNSSLNYVDVNYGTRIDVTNTSNVSIKNCNITNGSNTGIYVYSSSNFLAQYNTITNTNSYYGISITGGSNNNCYDNVMYKTDHVKRGIGIIYNSSSGNAARNDIEWFDRGVETLYGASVYSNASLNNINNRIANCNMGLWAGQQSQMTFGVIAQSNWGYNSIYGNNNYNAYTQNNSSSSILAQKNWWGNYPPDNLKFYIGSGCSIDYNYSISYDPWNGIPPHKIMPASNPENPSTNNSGVLAIMGTTAPANLIHQQQ